MYVGLAPHPGSGPGWSHTSSSLPVPLTQVQVRVGLIQAPVSQSHSPRFRSGLVSYKRQSPSPTHPGSGPGWSHTSSSLPVPLTQVQVRVGLIQAPVSQSHSPRFRSGLVSYSSSLPVPLTQVQVRVGLIQAPVHVAVAVGLLEQVVQDLAHVLPLVHHQRLGAAVVDQHLHHQLPKSKVWVYTVSLA